MSLNLKEVLKSKNEDLYHDLKLVAKKAEILLSRIVIDFPQYTLHDIKHSELVITRLNTIIPDNLKEKFNEYEIFFLLCSAYLHDIGMANLKQIKDDLGENTETIRKNHHKRSCIFIREYFNEIDLKNSSQGNNISRICLGHRKEDLTDSKLFPSRKAYQNYDINIALLASFLRIADELDITFERTPQLVYDNFNIDNEISKKEWERHLSIEGVITTHDSSYILCNARCKDPNIHRSLKKLEVKINSQLEDLPKHMHKYDDLIKELPRKFFMEIETIGYKYYNFKFSLDNMAIFNLLMGKNVYRSKDECIRELIKNSVDACKFRQETTINTYKPKITFELTSNDEKLIVTDNGMGMDDFIIEKYFTKIGMSYYRSEDFLNQELDFSPLNELGIGFLSCFMIADKIIIDTKTENGEPLEIEIDNTSDYFIVRKSKKESTGTNIILFLKEDIKGNLDLEKIISNYARHLEFAIYVNLPDDKKIEIKKQEFKSCLNPKENGKFIIKIEEDDFEGSICFEYGEDFYNHKDIVFNRANDNKILCNQGILINDNTNLLPEIIGSLCKFDINLKKNLLDWNIARNEIQYNDKYEKFLDKLELIIFNRIRDLFLEFKDSRKQTLLNSFYNNHGKKSFYNEPWSEITTINSFFDNSGGFTCYNKDIELPKSYLKLFLDFYNFMCISNDGLSFVNTDALLTKKIIYIDFDFEGFVTRNNLEEYLEYVFKSIDLNENCIYIIEPSNISKHILESFLGYQPQSFQNILLKKYENNLRIEDIIRPFGDKRKDILIINSNKCHDNRLILISFGDYIFINENNKLIQSLVKNRDKLINNEKIAIEGLFTSVRNSFSVHKKYKTILEMFVSNKKIKDDTSSYLLDEKELDLCRSNYIWKHE